MARPKTKTTSQIVADYAKKTYDRFDIKVKKDKAAVFKAKCAADGTNPNRLINEWIQNYIAPSE